MSLRCNLRKNLGLIILSCFAGIFLCKGAWAIEADDPSWVQVGTRGQDGWTATWFVGGIQPVPENSNITCSIKGISAAGDNYRHWITEVGISCASQKIITLSSNTFMNDGSVRTWEGKSRWNLLTPESVGEATYDFLCKPEQPRYRTDRWTRIAENVFIDLATRTHDTGFYAAWYKMDYSNNADGKQSLFVYVATPADERALIAADIVVERFSDGYAKEYFVNDLSLFGDDTMPKDSNYVVDMAKKYVVKEQNNW